MKAEIVPIGTEILLGNIVDTNSSFLANQLAPLGADLYYISAVGDNRNRIIETLNRAWARADLIITTGGLGPTQGDITRETIAEVLSEETTTDTQLWREIQDRLRHYHRDVPQANMKQATVIPSAQVIPNPVGTAPGWWIERDDHIVIAMPGPPHEMQLMWNEHVFPRLRQTAEGSILSKTLKTFGKGEAKVDELLEPFIKMANPSLATYARPDGIYLRITAKGSKDTITQHMIAEREADIRSILGPDIWGVDNETLESIVAGLLKSKHLSLAAMESCTQGLLSNTVASCPESLTCFKGGLVACCYEAKKDLGIDADIMEHFGTESRAVAEAMAEVAHRTIKADVGIGLDGTVSATKKMADIFIAVTCGSFKQVVSRTFLGDPCRMRQRAVYAALFQLRKILSEDLQCI